MRTRRDSALWRDRSRSQSRAGFTIRNDLGLTCALGARMVVPETLVQREELIGREVEIDSIGAFLDGLRGDPGALALEGDVTGVTKSSW